ncbi:MAG: hypothetical protein IPL73_10090 [Candidatus Obscuribacter sp.]|nr:hypothetical protein [Candidatus Obscuribacter sp.]
MSANQIAISHQRSCSCHQPGAHPGIALARILTAASGADVLSSACGMGQLSTLGDAALPRISDTQSSPQKPLEVVLKIDCRGVSLCPVRRDNLEFVEEKLLLSIDGQTFAKFSDKEIIAYVREHQGKLVDIELLNNDGSHKKDKLRLTYKLKNQLTDGYSLDWLKSNLRAIDGACEAPGWSQTLSGSGGTGVYLVDQAFVAAIYLSPLIIRWLVREMFVALLLEPQLIV